MQPNCWWRPEAQCRSCNQKGHVEKVCLNKHEEQNAQVVDPDEEDDNDRLFVDSCFASNTDSNAWLIDNDYTHHMSYDETIFQNLDRSCISKVKIGNEDNIEVKDKGNLIIDYVT